MSSLLKAARSAADRNRISVSSDRVARRLSAARDPTEEIADLLDDAGGQGDEIARGEPVGAAVRIDGHGAQRPRRDDVGRRARHQQALRQPSPLPLPGLPHQLMRLERSHVVVDLLPRDPDPRGERRGGGRLGQLGEQPAPDRFQGDDRGGRVVDDSHIIHDPIRPLTRKVVNGRSRGRVLTGMRARAVSLPGRWSPAPRAPRPPCAPVPARPLPACGSSGRSRG